MSTEVKLEKFSGPLDLLLQLVEKQEMEITEVSLSEVTEQFLRYLENVDDRSEDLADFLVIATRLVYLKSKTLLPYLVPEEDEGPSLTDQLKLYKQYLEASKKVNELWNANKIAYGRVEPPVKTEGFVLPANAQVTNIYEAMKKLVRRLQPLRPLGQLSVDKTISIKQKLESIYSLLKQHKHFSFQQALGNAKNRTEVIVTFLAILELVKDTRATVCQVNSFSELEIRIA